MNKITFQLLLVFAPAILSAQVILPAYQGVHSQGFVCGQDSVTDIDGNTYPTIQIGSQCWMAKNLRVTHYNDGSSITKITDNTSWTSTTSEAYCYYNNDSAANAVIYGCHYNWWAASSSNLCPVGWHVCSDENFKTLEVALGMSVGDANSNGWRGSSQAAQMAGTEDLWTNGALNNHAQFGSSNLNAVPAGYRNYATGAFLYQSDYCMFWMATESNSSEGINRYIKYDLNGLFRGDLPKRAGFSVRCIKNE